MSGRLHPTDAQAYWMSSKIPNDQFLLYCFETITPALDVVNQLVSNAQSVPELGIRFADAFGYPRTVPMTVGPHQVITHTLTDGTWTGCLRAVADLFAHPVDPLETPWLLHLFGSVSDAPRCTGPALVAVLQVSHALGDGRVASALARQLFGERGSSASLYNPRGRFRPIEFVKQSRRAQALERTLAADTAAGLIPPQSPGREKIRVNVAPAGERSIRTVVRDRAELSGPGLTVTVGAITAVSMALSNYLRRCGDHVPERLGAEVTLGKSGPRRARNHFRNAGIDLSPGIVDPLERAKRISAALRDRRARADHPAMAAQALASEMVPAVLLRWGIRQFDATVIPDTVTGNTVVSSVNRGAADLFLGGGHIRFTAGFPALSPVMGLTHGVHGIGDVVTISVTSSASAVDDPDVYVELVHDAVDEMAARLGRGV